MGDAVQTAMPKRLTKQPQLIESSKTSLLIKNNRTGLRTQSPNLTSPKSLKSIHHQRSLSNPRSAIPLLDDKPPNLPSELEDYESTIAASSSVHQPQVSNPANSSVEAKRALFTTAATSGGLDSPGLSGLNGPRARPPGPPHLQTSPDLRMLTPALRQSESFSSGDQANSQSAAQSSPTESNASNSKRHSDETNPAKRWRKKSGFSGVLSSVLGSTRNVKISAPENPIHVIHVDFDTQTGQFTVSVVFLHQHSFLLLSRIRWMLHRWEATRLTRTGSSQGMG